MVLLDSSDPPAPAAPERPGVATDPLLYPRQGLALERPASWTAELDRGVVQLRAPGREASVAITTDPRSVVPRDVRAAAVALVRETLDPVEVVGRTRLSFAGLAAPAVELRGRAPSGEEVTVVAAAARAPRRTYGLTVLRRERASKGRLGEVAAILESLRIGRPRR